MDYAEVRKYAKDLGVKTVARKKEDVLVDVLSAIQLEHSKATRLPEDEYEEWKEENMAMLKFYNKEVLAMKGKEGKATGKKATGKKATGKKATGKKATGKKATGKKATGKKAVDLSSARKRAGEAKAKKQPKKKERTKRASSVEVNSLGHRLGSQAANIDAAFNTKKFISMEGAAETAGVSVSRVRSHLKHIKEKHSGVLVEKNGNFKYAAK